MIDLYSDSDIKIAGSKPSRDIEKRREKTAAPNVPNKEKTENAKALGKRVALEFIRDSKDSSFPDENEDFEMAAQRRLLLSFTATVGFEQFCPDDTLCGIAQKSFIDTVKKEDNGLYKASSDTGAFSFYYLAYRRGSEILTAYRFIIDFRRQYRKTPAKQLRDTEIRYCQDEGNKKGVGHTLGSISEDDCPQTPPVTRSQGLCRNKKTLIERLE